MSDAIWKHEGIEHFLKKYVPENQRHPYSSEHYLGQKKKIELQKLSYFYNLCREVTIVFQEKKVHRGVRKEIMWKNEHQSQEEQSTNSKIVHLRQKSQNADWGK